jgi:putative transposase
MKQVVTAKLKLNLSPEQKESVRQVALAYRDALNYASQIAFDNNKISQAAKLQKLVYRDIRGDFKLPSQMSCNVPRQVAATYKTQ